MFTGIVKSVEKVIKNEDKGGSNRLIIGCANPSINYGKIDDSVAINGVCLTLIDINEKGMHFDVLPETLRSSNLGLLTPHDFVNVEPALRMGDSMGGHNIQGHVDATAQITSITKEGDGLNVDFYLDSALAALNIPKGFIAIDGISLTLTHIHAQGFSVMLIPHTQKHTCAQFWQKDSLVNIEIDAMAKTIFQFLQNTPYFNHKGNNNE